MSRPIPFEFQKFGNLTLVTLDSRFADYDFKPVMQNGKMMMQIPKKTIKDCRNIDGCVYFHLGRVSDRVMVDLIEKFQKLKVEKGWKPGKGLVVPDNKFII